MSHLKQTMATVAAASFYIHKPSHHKLTKWARTITITTTNTTTSTATSLTTKLKPNPKPKPLLALNSNNRGEQIAFIYKRGWRITPCAPPLPSAHDKGPSNTLGFRGLHHNKCGPSFSSRTPNLSSFSSSSSQDKGGFSGSGLSGSGLDADMGSEDKDRHGRVDNDLHRQIQTSSSKQNQQQLNSSKLLTLPTILTLGRVAAVPLLATTFYVDSWWGTTATTSIFIAAAVTDWLDGYLARKMRLGSAFGAFLDPVADKLMVAATLVLLCTRPFEVATFGQVPWLLTAPTIAIIGREITMSAVREWAASQDSKLLEAVAVNNLGKWKTATQMTALTILLATRDSSFGGPGILASGVILLYISAGLAVWSLVVYMRKIWRVLLR